MSLTDLDHVRLQQALALAERAIGLSDPNPRVGCVIGRSDGTILGQGHTQRAGEAHAEAFALREARGRGYELRGATAWVTLEPCSHHGRTPPCADALVDAGLGRVVVAMEDPNPLVLGQGINRLRAAGLTVDLAGEAVRRQATDLNIGFVSRHRRGRPWVRMKLAQSLDGRSALSNGESQWITGSSARADGHAWRKRAGAVITGIGTVVADDPRLDVRLVPTALQPLRVVVDSRWRIPATARVLDAPGQALVVGGLEGLDAAATRLADRAETLAAPAAIGGLPGVDLPELVSALAGRQIHELHIEAGGTLSGAFLTSGLVDELIVYVAPLFVGPGLPAANLPNAATLQQLDRWLTAEVCQVGQDVRWRLRHADADGR